MLSFKNYKPTIASSSCQYFCMRAARRCPVNYRVGLFVRVPKNQAAKSVSWWRCRDGTPSRAVAVCVK